MSSSRIALSALKRRPSFPPPQSMQLFGPIPARRFQLQKPQKQMTEEEKLAEKREKTAAYQRAYRAANKDKIIENRRRHYAANKDEILAQQRKYAAANRDAILAHKRESKYGISQDQFAAMLTEQNFQCAICSTTEPGRYGTFHVDHCHTSGSVRGLLCHRCNVGLGQFRDNTAFLLRAIDYISAAQGTPQ